MRPFVHFLLWNVGLKKAETQTTEAERDCLARHARGKKHVVEIGTWHGVTTKRLLRAMDRQGVIWGVDPYPRGRLGFSVQQVIAWRETLFARKGRLEWVRKTGEEAARYHASRGEPRVDLLFIDGDHSYDGIRGDWEGWRDRVAEGGIVALHDSRPTADRPIHEAGSVRYTQDVILKDPDFETVDTIDSLTVLRRRARAH